MTIDPCSRYSDLEFARQLTRRLRGEVPKDQEPRPKSQYVRFPKAGFTPGATTHGGATAVDWNQLVDECLQDLGARSVCVLSQEGLAVAVGGELESDQAERIGARLMIGLDQARQLNDGPATPSLCAEIDRGWVSAFPLGYAEEDLLLVVLADAPVFGPRQQDVVRRVRARLDLVRREAPFGEQG